MQNVRRRTGATGVEEGHGATGKPRGRPRAFDRDVALDTAMRLFWRKGFSATSISDLTEAMGIGSPSLYAAFGSKEELYVEALRRFGEIAHPLIWSSLEHKGSAREAVEAFLLASAAALPADGDYPGGCMMTLSTAGAEGCAALGDLVETGRADAMRLLEQRIGRGRDAGEFSAEMDVSALARFFLAVQQGMCVQARDGASREELEKIARAAVRAWPARLTKVPSRASPPKATRRPVDSEW